MVFSSPEHKPGPPASPATSAPMGLGALSKVLNINIDNRDWINMLYILTRHVTRMSESGRFY